MSQRKAKTPKINVITHTINLTALVLSADRRTGVYRADSLSCTLPEAANDCRHDTTLQIAHQFESTSGRGVSHIALYHSIDIESIEGITGPDHLQRIEGNLASKLWHRIGEPRQPDLTIIQG